MAKGRPILWAVVLLVVALGGLGYWRYGAIHRAPEVQFRSAPVEHRSIVGKVTASGTLSAIVTVQVGTQVSGRIQKLYADYNSQVTHGQLVAKIDPQLFDAAVQQAQANYLSAKAGQATAEATQMNADRVYAREKALHDQNLAAQADLDTAEAAVATSRAGVDAAKASVAQALAQLHQAQVNLSYTNIVSPIDGVVISRSVDVGQTVAASLSAPTLFTIAQDLTKMQVDTNVAEGDVGRLQVGMKTYFTVDSFPGQRFFGKIRQIRNAATTVQNVVTYDAVIDVDNSDLRLRPGMTANVTVVYAEERGVLAVPNAALRFRPPPSMAPGGEAAAAGRGPQGAGPGAAGRGPGGAGSASTAGDRPQRSHGGSQPAASSDAPAQKTLWVLAGQTPRSVTVHAGLTDGSYTEIVDGDVHEGDAVIVDTVGGETPPAPTGGGGGPSFRRLF